MIVFLDFEASSLSDNSYPIEVGWVFEDGRGEDHLIRPAPLWTDWDPNAEAIHGFTRARLIAEGEPHDAVARHLLASLGAHEVFATAPSWDGKWLSVLLRAAGLPRHAMRLKDADAAHLAAARGSPELVVRARAQLSDRPVRHRALADAEAELRLWQAVRRLAGEA